MMPAKHPARTAPCHDYADSGGDLRFGVTSGEITVPYSCYAAVPYARRTTGVRGFPTVSFYF